MIREYLGRLCRYTFVWTVLTYLHTYDRLFHEHVRVCFASKTFLWFEKGGGWAFL